jgi:hypothetical protein
MTSLPDFHVDCMGPFSLGGHAWPLLTRTNLCIFTFYLLCWRKDDPREEEELTRRLC